MNKGDESWKELLALGFVIGLVILCLGKSCSGCIHAYGTIIAAEKGSQ